MQSIIRKLAGGHWSGPVRFLSVCVLVLSTSTAAAGSAPSAGSSLLRVSKVSDRAFAADLQGQATSGNIYAYVPTEADPAARPKAPLVGAPAVRVKKVRFYFDDPRGKGRPYKTEGEAPFDLAGGTADAAAPFATRSLRDGTHTLTASIDLAGGKTITSTATFTVHNATRANRAIYWGAAVEGVPWNMTTFETWGNLAGKQPSIVHFWQYWHENGLLHPFEAPLLKDIRGRGAIPMMTWLPSQREAGRVQPDFQLGDIIAGKYDDYLQDWAQDARDWGHPFFLRLAHEMNGNWFAWGESANGNQRGQFVQAWKHIVDIFRAAGAKNVTWVWCPNIDWSGSGWPTMRSLYPGDDYVDWTCLDGFNWGGGESGWRSFEEVFRWSYEYLRDLAPAKPVMIGEFGSAEQGGSKAAWMTETLTRTVPYDFPEIRAVVMYDFNAAEDWRIVTSPTALQAFRTAIRSPYYAANTFGDLSQSPIPPLP